MEQQILNWISQYGYLAIFLLLVFGIVGLPIPDETLLAFTGYVVFKGHLSLAPAFAAACVGAIMLIELANRQFQLVQSEGSAIRLFGVNLDAATAPPLTR